MAYDTTEAVAKFLSGFQMKITKRERDTVAPDYYVKYLLTLSKGGKDFSTTFVSDPRAFGEPTVTPAKGYGGLCHPGKPCRRNLKRPLL